jgi:hypothetical protein
MKNSAPGALMVGPTADRAIRISGILSGRLVGCWIVGYYTSGHSHGMITFKLILQPVYNPYHLNRFTYKQWVEICVPQREEKREASPADAHSFLVAVWLVAGPPPPSWPRKGNLYFSDKFSFPGQLLGGWLRLLLLIFLLSSYS